MGYHHPMNIEIFIVVALIAILSLVQSYFGIGLLIFGTPSLLLLGYDFHVALTYLLPASFVISLMQVLLASQKPPATPKSLYFICLPAIGLGLWIAGSVYYLSWINFSIGIMLLAFAMFRLLPIFANKISVLFNSNPSSFHLLIGLIHGLTNLGGALLVIFANSTKSNKDEIRYTIAYYYLLFSSVQLLLLAAIMGHLQDVIAHASTAAISGSIYLIFGNRIFNSTSNRTFSFAMTLFIAAFGIVLMLGL